MLTTKSSSSTLFTPLFSIVHLPAFPLFLIFVSFPPNSLHFRASILLHWPGFSETGVGGNGISPLLPQFIPPFVCFTLDIGLPLSFSRLSNCPCSARSWSSHCNWTISSVSILPDLDQTKCWGANFQSCFPHCLSRLFLFMHPFFPISLSSLHFHLIFLPAPTSASTSQTSETLTPLLHLENK